ncbi:hypothetical protein ACIRBX_31180 [Kitasatospora sp. NPDC096147]|uniref:hypothetical protein n=1 Tax=Kitasatospora sp. NPDC096147 TaxID=3364093 RepID=UPI00381D54AF
MKRREFLLLSALGLSPLALVIWPVGGDKKSAAAADPLLDGPEPATDPAFVRGALARLGPVLSAHWTEISSNAYRSERGIPGPTDLFYSIVAQLPPGQVAKIIGQLPVQPAEFPPVQQYPTTPETVSHSAVPATLLPYLPPAPSWVSHQEIDRLLDAHSGRVLLDRASDTVFVHAVDLDDPTEVKHLVDVNGNTSTSTPIPLPPLP